MHNKTIYYYRTLTTFAIDAHSTVLGKRFYLGPGELLYMKNVMVSNEACIHTK